MFKVPDKSAERLLSKTVPEYAFGCRDGRLCRSLRELGEAINTMKDDVFTFHMNERRNHFADWIRDVIKDKQLAYELNYSNNKKQVAKTISRRLTFLEAKLV